MPTDDKDRLIRALAVEAPGSSDFDLNPDVVLPAGRKLRPAAVLIAYREADNGPAILLTKRSSALKHHPGQIAFPGGKKDEDDQDLVACALREAFEEVGLPPEHVEVLGLLPSHETVTGFDVTPVLAKITADFEERREAGEVEEVFWVPLSHVTDPGKFVIEGRRWQGRRRRYYAVPYGPYYIWGATARMLRGLAERLA
ncbi:CoA pyrophosphatase [Roseobacteraceae bacterium S113]